jgi:DNA-binding transcriptional LysR family regulator
MRISLDALEVLDAIERNGSFAAAAVELHRVPSAMTYQIQKLEQDLDALLFDRRGHRAVLTAAGRELLAEGRILLRAAGDLEHRIRRIATGWEPELRIAVDTIVPFAAILPLIDRFDQYCTEKAATHTRLRLTNEVLGGPWDALVAGRADVAIGAPGEPPTGHRIRTRLLAEVEMVFAVSPRHSLASATEPIADATLQQHRIVAIADTSRVSPPRTIGLIEGQDTLTVPDMPGKLAAQIAGLGCGWLPRFLVSPLVATEALQIKRVDEPRAAVPVHIAWITDRPGKALAWWLKALDDGRWAAMLTR